MAGWISLAMRRRTQKNFWNECRDTECRESSGRTLVCPHYRTRCYSPEYNWSWRVVETRQKRIDALCMNPPSISRSLSIHLPLNSTGSGMKNGVDPALFLIFRYPIAWMGKSWKCWIKRIRTKSAYEGYLAWNFTPTRIFYPTISQTIISPLFIQHRIIIGYLISVSLY